MKKTITESPVANGENARQEAAAFVESIANNPTVTRLAEGMGYVNSETDDVSEKLAALKAFSNQEWDFRNGKERQDTSGTEFDAIQSAAIFEAAQEWNMVESSEPSKTHYDFVTVLGGANKSPLLRVRYAKEQMEKHNLEVPYMVLLGSSRPLSDAEKNNTKDYALGAEDEFSLMNGAVETEFGISHTDEKIIDLHNFSPKATDKDMWRVRYYEATNGMHILSVSAPQIEGERRVNTADTYRFMDEVVGHEMLNDANVLNVTNAHFVPFQNADAERLLGLKANAHVETIGYSADYAGITRKPHELLQEMNSAINQTVLLQQALEQ